MDISRHQFNKLISCSKEIVSPSRPKFDEKNGSRHMNLKLYSTAEDLYFRMFLRQSTIFLENFSVGLIWTVQESNICITLLRCNGPHGGNKNCAYHHVPHIHRLNLELATENTFKENDVEMTQVYSTFDSAIYHFCTMCHIQNAQVYFPEVYNLSLFES